MSCISGGDYAKNWGENIGFGILNFFGIGDFIKNASGAKTPLDDLKDQLSAINVSTQEIMQQGNLLFMNTQVSINTPYSFKFSSCQVTFELLKL